MKLIPQLLHKTMTINPVPSSSDEITGVMLSYHHQRLSVATDDGYLIFPIHQILFIRAYSNYSTIHFANGKDILTSKTLKLWEQEINHSYFIRCHRSFLINSRYVDCICRKESLISIHNHKIPVSRDRKASLFFVF